MREILFRGKDRLGHWLEGGFHLWETRQPCVFDDKLKPDEIKHIIIKNSFADWNMPRQMQPYEVIPETIGQYTGLTDKNGKKIFEEDIVKVTNDNGETNLCSCGIGDVCFYDGAWYIGGEVNDGLYDVKNIYYIEVIGNIHDNPELLESEVDTE